mgnify:FL=1
MNSYVVKTTPTFIKALSVANKTAESGFVETAVTGVAVYSARVSLAGGENLNSYITDCGALSGTLKDVCAEGFAVGLIENGNPGEEYVAAIATCAKSGALAEACFRGVSLAVRDRLDPAIYERVCSDIAKEGWVETGQECLNIMKEKVWTGKQ